MSDERNDNAGVVAPPPLIYAGALAFGMIMNRLAPAGFLPCGLRKLLGIPLVIGGFAVGFLGFREIRHAETTTSPYEPVTTLVTEDSYRFTRNPMYLGFTLQYAGVSALSNALWPMLMLPGVLTVMNKGVIVREERYLEEKFGEEYLQYKSEVKRWI